MKTLISIGLGWMVFAGTAVAEESGKASAKQTWEQLVGQKFAARPAFAYVENDPALPNVLIYGDSISIAYTQRTRDQLKGTANVYRLYCNGSDSGQFINRVTRMHDVMCDEGLDQPWTFQWDVIHVNVGLHDLKYVLNGKLDTKNGKQVSSLDTYRENLHAIVAYATKLAPKATLIFATTTPVPEKSNGRIAGDAATYNAVALEVMQQYPAVLINDLYALTKPHQPQWWTRPGNVHFNQTGANAQGDAVAGAITEALTQQAGRPE